MHKSGFILHLQSIDSSFVFGSFERERLQITSDAKLSSNACACLRKTCAKQRKQVVHNLK